MVKIQKIKIYKLMTALFLFISIPEAYAEKIKLVCNVDVVTDYSSGNTNHSNEKIQVDIETIKDQIFISSSGVDVGFSLFSYSTKPNIQVLNSSDEDTYMLDVKHEPIGEGDRERQENIKIDRNTGILYYRFIGNLMKTATGSCLKIDLKKRAF